jgi:hypothetical protein
VAWQSDGSHVARSDDGGRTFVQTPEFDVFGRDLGDVDIAVGGPTPCATPVAPTTITIGTATAQTGGCLPGTHRVYVSSLERTPLILTGQARLHRRPRRELDDQRRRSGQSVVHRPAVAGGVSAHVSGD